MSKLQTFGKSIVSGRKNYSPKVKKILSQFGDVPIQRIFIKRTPLGKLMKAALNIASLGEFNKKFKNIPYDELYHLRLDIETSKGRVTLEKNEVINMDVRPKTEKNTQSMLVEDLPSGLTINEMLEKTKSDMGAKFYVYQAKSNNCQFFVMSILRANDLDTKQNEEFVIQDATSLFSDSFRKTSNTVTDIGAAVNTLTDNDVIKKSVDTTKKTMKKAKNTAEMIAEKAKQVLLGSGIFDDIGRAVRKVGKTISKGSTNVIDKIATSKKRSAAAEKLLKGFPPNIRDGIMKKINDANETYSVNNIKKASKAVKEDVEFVSGSGIFDDIGRAVTKTVKKIAPKNIGKVGIDVLNESKRLGSKAGEGYAFVNPFDLGYKAGYKGAEAVDKGLSKGKGVGRKKMIKGSPEAIAWGKKMREARMKNKGGD